MSLLKKHNTVKNSMKEEYEIPENLDLLNRWTIPKIEPRLIYELGSFEKLGLKQVVKTTEETIPLHGEDTTIKLFEQNDLNNIMKTHKYIHIGCVQIAFKPLTLEGLPESFIAALRDGRNLDWKKSLMGLIRTSLAHGPVYFEIYPNLQVALTDPNIYDTLTLNVKTHGYNYKIGTEIMAVCYRIYYKPLYTLNPRCKRFDKSLNETIIIETNFNKSNITTRRKCKWDEITFPEQWIIENIVPSQPNINTNLIDVVQTPEGTVKLQFEDDKKYSITDRSNYSYISPVDYKIEFPYTPSKASTSQIRETVESENSEEDKISKLYIKKNNIVKGINESNISKEPDITESEMDFRI